MYSRTKTDLRGRRRILVVSFFVVAMLGSVGTGVVSAFQSSQEEETARKLKIASVQHELILLLVEKKDFDRVEAEWKKVLDLKLDGKYEGAIAQSLLAIGYKLSEAKQFALAQKILDESLPAVEFSNKDRADILRFKAYLFKEAGDLDAAIGALRQAGELAGKQ